MNHDNGDGRAETEGTDTKEEERHVGGYGSLHSFSSVGLHGYVDTADGDGKVGHAGDTSDDHALSEDGGEVDQDKKALDNNETAQLPPRSQTLDEDTHQSDNEPHRVEHDELEDDKSEKSEPQKRDKHESANKSNKAKGQIGERQQKK